MRISLSSAEALEEFRSLYYLGQKPGFMFPAFCIETEFIDFFFHIIAETPQRNNVVPFMNRLIDQALTESIDHICTILDRHKVDGTAIFELMEQKQFIQLGVKRAYNKQLPGKSPKGLTSPGWCAYNNWVLTEILWKAYLQSHHPDFRVTIVDQEDSDAPVDAFYSADFRPLWAMKHAYVVEAGRPISGSANTDIFIRPIREWYLYIKAHADVALPKMGFTRV